MSKFTEERLFQNHTKEQIMHWCQHLNFFHFMRARGAHYCESDSFCAHFSYSNLDDLNQKLGQLGVTLKTLDKNSIPFDPFGSYSIDDLDKIKYTIQGNNNLEQPQEVIVFDQKVHIWVQQSCFEISISGSKNDSNYEVSDKDFEVCLDLEKEFERLDWQQHLDSDITNHAHCISRKLYPELY